MLNSDWKESGIALAFIIRKQPNRNFLIGCYLMDVYCLGIKNTFCNGEVSEKKIQEEILPRFYAEHPYAITNFDYIKSIVFGALKYARELGFEPHPDFQLSRNVLGKEETVTSYDDIRFGGPEGKPLYIAGPDDRIDAILNKLTKRLGKDGFQYVVPMEV